LVGANKSGIHCSGVSVVVPLWNSKLEMLNTWSNLILDSFFSVSAAAASDIKRRAARCVSSASNNTQRPCVSSLCINYEVGELSGDYINTKTRNYEAACNIVFNHRFLVLCFRIFPSQL